MSLFPDIFYKPIIVQFDHRHGSSDGGALLLKAADHRLRLTETLLQCMSDNPVVDLNHAIVVAMVHGQEQGLERLDSSMRTRA